MLNVVIDKAQVERALKGYEKQIPYALKVALDTCLFTARKQIHGDLKNYFTIRTPWFAKGLRVDRPTKKSLMGTVGFLESRWFAASQVEGDPKRKKPGNKPIWQPLETGPRSPRPVHNKPIIASRRPNVASAKHTGKRRDHGPGIVNEPRYFKIIKSKKIFPGIYYRPDGEKRKIVAAYWLEPFMKIEPRYPMNEKVVEAVGRVWEAAATKAITHALKTARGPG